MNNTLEGFACPDVFNVVDTCSWQFVILTGVLSLVEISILAGNVMVILAVATCRKLRRSVSNLFILSLAVTDLMLAVLILPLSLLNQVLGYWILGEVVCGLWLLMDITICTASILHLCAISVDRYIAICHPLRYHQLMTKTRSRFICLGLWLLAFLCSMPVIIWRNSSLLPKSFKITNSNTARTSTVPTCLISLYPASYIACTTIASFLIPAVITAGLHIRIYVTARKHIKQAQHGMFNRKLGDRQSCVMRIHQRNKIAEGSTTKHDKCNDSKLFSDITAKQDLSSTTNLRPSPVSNNRRQTKHDSHHKRDVKAMKTVSIIVSAFFLCWTPFFINYFLVGVVNIKENKVVSDVVFWVGYANSLLNPIIYAIMVPDFQKAFHKILKCSCQK